MKTNNWRQTASLLLTSVALILATACATETDEVVETSGQTTTTTSAGGVTISDTNASGASEGGTRTAANADDLVANSSFSERVTITYNGSTAAVSGSVSGVTATVSGANVTITSSAKGVEYVLSGTASAGSFKLYSANKCRITLSGVQLTNPSGPAINVQKHNGNSGRVFIVSSDGTTNTLADGSSYSTPTGEDAKGTIFAEGKLIFSGTGSLTVKGNYKHAIDSDDYARIASGTLTVSGAVKDAIHANDAIIVDGGTISLKASSDGMDAEEGYVVINGGTFNINVADDAIAASYDLTASGADTSITPYVTINGGTFTINTSEGEGIESKSVLTINGGTFAINAYDDGLNATRAIYINGGNLYVKSSTNDAIDSNGTLTVTGGRVIAIGATAPEGAFDSDENTFKITGGTLIGIGGASSTPTASASSQRSILTSSLASAGTLLHIRATDGSEALTFLVPSGYSTMLYSSAKLKAGTTYNVYTGGSVSGGTHFNSLYTSGTYSGGAESGTSFTTSSMVTTVGNVNFGPGGGIGLGGGGGWRP